MKRHAPDSQNALLSALAPSATTCLQLDSTAASNIVTSLPPQHSCSVTTTTTSHLLCPKAEEDDDGNTCHCWHVCLCFFSLFFQMTDLFFSFFLSHLDTFSLCRCWRGGGEYRRRWLGEDKGKWQMAPGMFFVLFFSSFTNDTHYFYCLASPFSTNRQWWQHQPPTTPSFCLLQKWVGESCVLFLSTPTATAPDHPLPHCKDGEDVNNKQQWHRAVMYQWHISTFILLICPHLYGCLSTGISSCSSSHLCFENLHLPQVIHLSSRCNSSR